MYHEIVLIGVLISLIFSELTGLSPAGLIVSGYIVLSLQTPQRVIYTLFLAFAAWGIGKILGNYMILYGRRRFAVMVLLTYMLDLIVSVLGGMHYIPSMIGVLVPGIMSNEFERQGLFKTLLSLCVVVGILSLIMLWQGMKVFPG